MSKSKSKPQTIADLKFNWIFTDYDNESLDQKEARFKKQNKSLLKYKIQRQDYRFLVNDSQFTICTYDLIQPVESFIEGINFKLSYCCSVVFLKNY